MVGAQGASIFIGSFACKAIKKQTNRINDQLIALRIIPVGKLTVPKLVQQLPALYGIKYIIALLTRQWVLPEPVISTPRTLILHLEVLF
jgi:hypothetical protein